MNLKRFTFTLSLSAFFFLAYSCDKNEMEESGSSQEEQKDSNIIDMLKKCSEVKTVQKWNETKLTEGITHMKVQVIKKSERPASINIVVMEPDAAGAALKTGCCEPTENNPFPMMRPSEIANKFDKDGERVMAVMSGDFFRWDPNENGVTSLDFGCRGPVHHRGKILQDHFVPQHGMVHQALSFLAVDKAGKVLIADADKYHGMSSNLQECTGGGYQPLRDGKICKGFDIYLDGTYIPLEDKYPFSCIGYREDGTVIFMVVDGRSEISMGLTYAEAGSLMKSMGCTNAITMDGGGSAQMVIKDPKTGNFTLQNKPTDGAERTMRTFWMITVKE